VRRRGGARRWPRSGNGAAGRMWPDGGRGKEGRRTAAAAMKDGGQGGMRGGTLDPAEAWRRTCSGGRQEAGRRTG